MTLARILSVLQKSTSRARRAGLDVPDLFPEAEFLGAGCFRSAYRVGNFVIKLSRPRCAQVGRRPPVATLRRAGILPPEEWHVNGWTVQRYYRRVTDGEFRSKGAKEFVNSLDICAANSGLDRWGRVVAIDW